MDRFDGTAEEFVAHWFGLVNQAYSTGDVSALEDASDPACKTCASTIATIAEQYATGGSFEGGEISVEMAVASAPNETGTFILSAQIDQAPLRKIAHDGREGDVSDGESDLLLSIAAVQSASGWKLAAISSETP